MRRWVTRQNSFIGNAPWTRDLSRLWFGIFLCHVSREEGTGWKCRRTKGQCRVAFVPATPSLPTQCRGLVVTCRKKIEIFMLHAKQKNGFYSNTIVNLAIRMNERFFLVLAANGIVSPTTCLYNIYFINNPPTFTFFSYYVKKFFWMSESWLTYLIISEFFCPHPLTICQWDTRRTHCRCWQWTLNTPIRLIEHGL